MTLLRAPASGVERADRREQVEEPLGRAEPAHPAQHRLAGVLERQVEVRRDAGRGGDRLDQAGPGLGRLQVADPHPDDAGAPRPAAAAASPAARGSPRSLPYEVEFSLTSTSSRTPSPASHSASASSSSRGRGRRTRRGTPGWRRTRTAGRSRWPASAARPGRCSSRRRSTGAQVGRGVLVDDRVPGHDHVRRRRRRTGVSGSSSRRSRGRVRVDPLAGQDARRAGPRCRGSRRSPAPRAPRAGCRRAPARTARPCSRRRPPWRRCRRRPAASRSSPAWPSRRSRRC